VALDQVPLAVDEELEEDEVEVVAPPELLGTLVPLLHALINAPASRQAMTAPASLVRRVATCKRWALWVTSSQFFVVRPEGDPPRWQHRRPSTSPGTPRNRSGMKRSQPGPGLPEVEGNQVDQWARRYRRYLRRGERRRRSSTTIGKRAPHCDHRGTSAPSNGARPRTWRAAIRERRLGHTVIFDRDVSGSGDGSREAQRPLSSSVIS